MAPLQGDFMLKHRAPIKLRPLLIACLRQLVVHIEEVWVQVDACYLLVLVGEALHPCRQVENNR